MISLIKKFLSVEGMIAAKDRKGALPPSKEVYGTFLRMAWPSALESVFVSLIGSIDTIMVGDLGANAIAAVGLTNQPKFILLAMIYSLNVGVTAIVARRKGENEYEGANRCLKQCLIISFVLSILMAIIGYIYARPILLFAGAEPDIIDLSVAYFRILMVSNVFTAITLTINAAQRGVGNTKVSLRTNMVANVVNIIFNYFLIGGHWFFPKMGVSGAALATAIGNAVGCLMAISSLFYRAGFLELKSHVSWKFDRKTISSVVNISGSALVEQVFMRIGFFSYAKIVAALGTVAFATHQICMNIINISFAFGDGFAVAASSLVGQSLGAKRPDMAKVYGKTGQRVAFGMSTILFFIFIFGRRVLVGFFSTEPEILALGSVILIIIACSTHAQTSQVVVSGCLRGAGDTRFVALTSLISIALVRPILSYVLCFPVGWGLIGAWIGLSCDHYIRLLINFSRFNSGKWTKIEV